jgi:hypothetical protein
MLEMDSWNSIEITNYILKELWTDAKLMQNRNLPPPGYVML